MHVVGEGPDETLSALRRLSHLINSFLTDIKQLAKDQQEDTVPLLMSMSEAFSVPFYTLIKLCYTKALEWSSLVPGPEVKSSSEIMNPTPFTESYHCGLHSASDGASGMLCRPVLGDNRLLCLLLLPGCPRQPCQAFLKQSALLSPHLPSLYPSLGVRLALRLDWRLFKQKKERTPPSFIAPERLVLACVLEAIAFDCYRNSYLFISAACFLKARRSYSGAPKTWLIVGVSGGGLRGGARGRLKGEGYMYTYSWCTWLYSRN